MTKSKQLQIRVSPSELRQIKAYAKAAGKAVSEWVLDTVLPSELTTFHRIVSSIPVDQTYALAELNDFFEDLSPERFEVAVSEDPSEELSLFEANYLAAMVEHTSHLKRVKLPQWVHSIPPLSTPHFGSSLKNLRLHLLTASPAPFRSRNIFIDSTVGDRV